MIVCPAQEAVGYTGVTKSCEYRKPILIIKMYSSDSDEAEKSWNGKMLGWKVLLGKHIYI
jgi:hypothetical protein